MEPQIRTLVDISESQASLSGRADIVLERARWASYIFQRFDKKRTMKIVDAVANVAHSHAGEWAEQVVVETGFGVVSHKKLKNEFTAKPLVDYYREQDLVSMRVKEEKKIVEIPRPAGVIFALIPSTNPISTLNFKIILALITRNSIVISPHPAAKKSCIDAVRILTEAAISSGAPEGAIQVLETPSIPLIEEFMSSPKTNVILATGGTAMVRAAYSSSNPAIGVGPGNAPVFVDSSADIALAANQIVTSKSFDNSVLCTSESNLITLTDVDKPLRKSLKNEGAYICNNNEVVQIRNYLFHPNGFNVEALGRDAVWIARECGIRVPKKTLILVTPINSIGIEEPLAREKLCPVLSFYVANSPKQAIAQSRATLRATGAGHSAVIHSQNERMILDFASRVECYRVVVNASCSLGASGFNTNLAPSFTIGTGFYGRSSLGENLGPQHLIHWTQIAYNSDPSVAFGKFNELSLSLDGPLPRSPSDGVPGSPKSRRVDTTSTSSSFSIDNVNREELRKLIAEELKNVLKK